MFSDDEHHLPCCTIVTGPCWDRHWSGGHWALPVGRRFIRKLLHGWEMPVAATTKLQHLPGFLALEYRSICIWSMQAHLCLLQQGVFMTSVGVLSRRRTLIALFSCTPLEWQFNWPVITIRIRVLYGSIIRPNTSNLFELNVRYGPSNKRQTWNGRCIEAKHHNTMSSTCIFIDRSQCQCKCVGHRQTTENWCIRLQSVVVRLAAVVLHHST